jgi:phage-related protein
MAISGGDGSIILTTKVDETGLKKGFASMRNFVGKVGKSFAVIGAAAATATVAITKMAVSAYADYEQMVGGIETLWGKSAKKIVDYANDAFYTAGVSANNYMKQVTQFSAALIRSTAGDTEKAADIANMAMIDISDNVAKMGTNIEYVQLAYQGFARQQYILLDNLRLGYGGTKQEMERLLVDAEALTGVKYDIKNLSDVYTAIHVIQEELGIAGATAMEAERTISGSAKMIKAAWQNVLSAIAGGGDLDRAINNLVYSIQKYFENIVPVVERSLVGIGRLIEQVAPMLVQNVASALIQSIPSLINAIYQMIVGLAKGIWQGIKALFTGGSGSVTADIKTSVGGIASSAGEASTGMEELGDATEKAGKQAKKSLAAFDDLNIISSGAGGGAGKTPEIATGGIGGANVPTAESTMDIKAEETGEQATWLSQRLDELAEAFSGLQDIDLSNLSNSLGLLKEPLQGLAEIAWDMILWGIEEVIVPLTEFTVEEVLPRFFETLSNVLRLFKTILDEGFEIFKQFYDEFLKPIASYAAEGFLQLWDTLNENLEEFVTIVENSTAWQDLQTILGLIYDVLEPVVKWIIDFVVWVGKLIINQAWTTLKWIFLDIEDALGLIADIINGDFDGAWEHLKDLMWDNRIDMAKENLDNLKTAFGEVKTKVDEFVEDWKLKIDDMVESWKTKISAWWTDNVEPWFTKEKWEELFFKIGQSLANAIVGVNGFVEKWKTNITNWWKDDVAPWFTTAKWKEVFDNIVTSISDFFTAEDGFVQTWKTKISEWWTNEVAPWFTVEKWKELGEHIKDGLVDGFNGAINGIRGIINKILDGFQGLVNGAIDMLNSLISGWNKVADVTPGLPSISSIKHIDLSKYKLPMLAQGAVIPPNRQFLAVLGDQKHGTNIEAPLQTIVDAFNIALQGNANYGGGNTEVVLEIDGREFGRAVVEQGNRENRRIGTRLVIA